MTTIQIEGKSYVLIREEAYDRLVAAAEAQELAPVPQPDRKGRRPAVATADALIARTIMRRRVEAGLTQEELARRASVRAETISRLESGKHIPQRATFAKIDDALTAAGV